jgi:hypothetical protein
LKQEKFDPVVLLNLIGGKSWRIKGKNLGPRASIMYSPVQRWLRASDANFRQLNQDVSSGTPSLGTNTFTAMEEPISLTSLQF